MVSRLVMLVVTGAMSCGVQGQERASSAPAAESRSTRIPPPQCRPKARVTSEETYPRTLADRGINIGVAIVRFRIRDRKAEILEVEASRPEFADVARRLVASVDCDVEGEEFELPFTFRRET